MRRQTVKKEMFKISFENTDVEIDMKTGKAKSFLSLKHHHQSGMSLHKTLQIYYSDIFALSLITIALTGTIMIKSGKFSFKERGWKLALAGILFPLLFLFLLA
jgi:hypothetical protein